WSVRVYKHDSSSSPSYCVNSTDGEFSNNTFSDGSQLTNQITDFRVYTNPNCSDVPTAPPTAPSNLSVTNATENALTISWQDKSRTEQGFRVYRWAYTAQAMAFVPLTTVSANTTSFTQSGLQCGDDFNFYQIAAYNQAGESGPTSWVQGTTAI